jgi:HEAT repeat protein
MKRLWMIGLLVTGLTAGGVRPAFAQPTSTMPQSSSDRAMARATARDRALQIILAAATGDDADLRSNAIEAIQVMPDRALPLTQRGLTDPNAGVRFAAVVTAAKLNFKTLAPGIEPLKKDENMSVRAAAIYSLYRLGRQVDITPLADMLRSQDPKLRANVALIMGMMGDNSAIPMLKSAAGAPMPKAGDAEAAVVRCQVAEAVVKLGDDSELDTLRAGVFNSLGEVRVLSINALGEVKDRRMVPALARLLDTTTASEPIEVRLAAAASMGRMGDNHGLATLVSGTQDPNPVVRAQAGWGLGWFDDADSMDRLVQLLADGSPMVRVAAAASVLRRTADR